MFNMLQCLSYLYNVYAYNENVDQWWKFKAPSHQYLIYELDIEDEQDQKKIVTERATEELENNLLKIRSGYIFYTYSF